MLTVLDATSKDPGFWRRFPIQYKQQAIENREAQIVDHNADDGFAQDTVSASKTPQPAKIIEKLVDSVSDNINNLNISGSQLSNQIDDIRNQSQIIQKNQKLD